MAEKTSILYGIKKIIPYTLKGVFFFFLSAGIFLIGIVRADLAALFWGCGFLLVTFYALFGNHICKIIFKKYFTTHQQSVNLCFSENGICVGSSASAHLNVILPGFILPGFSIKLILLLTWHTRDPISLVIFLSPGKNKVELPFTIQHRGKYSCDAIHFRIEDLLGFSNATYTVGLEEYITVYPGLINREELMFRITGDESTDIQKKRRSNDELLEVKKYYPGDDIKRLNWKIFAHSKELFIRKGEETPPPDSKFLFILDPSISPYISPSFNLDFLDRLIEVMCSIMMTILDNGNILYLSLPGRSEVLTFAIKQKDKLLTLLSEIWWTEEQTKIRLPAKQKMHALVFTSPGSLSLPHIIKVLKARDWDVSLFLKNYTFPHIVKNDFDIKNLFFVSNKKILINKILQSDMIIFNQALFTELERYKMAPWRIEDVREI